MTIVTLKRFEQSDDGTLGVLSVDGFKAFTIEPAWRNNARGISCIPPGRYGAYWRNSPKFGWTYCLTGTAPRELILIHSGNFAGNEDKGRVTHTNGCILLGSRHGVLRGATGFDQTAVLNSRPTVRAFGDFMKQQRFELEISQPWT